VLGSIGLGGRWCCSQRGETVEGVEGSEGKRECAWNASLVFDEKGKRDIVAWNV
jgi:hypothetical protein